MINFHDYQYANCGGSLYSHWFTRCQCTLWNPFGKLHVPITSIATIIIIELYRIILIPLQFFSAVCYDLYDLGGGRWCDQTVNLSIVRSYHYVYNNYASLMYTEKCSFLTDAGNILWKTVFVSQSLITKVTRMT